MPAFWTRRGGGALLVPLFNGRLVATSRLIVSFQVTVIADGLSLVCGGLR